jgi:hypothetical protein
MINKKFTLKWMVGGEGKECKQKGDTWKIQNRNRRITLNTEMALRNGK